MTRRRLPALRHTWRPMTPHGSHPRWHPADHFLPSEAPVPDALSGKCAHGSGGRRASSRSPHPHPAKDAQKRSGKAPTPECPAAAPAPASHSHSPRGHPSAFSTPGRYPDSPCRQLLPPMSPNPPSFRRKGWIGAPYCHSVHADAPASCLSSGAV